MVVLVCLDALSGVGFLNLEVCLHVVQDLGVDRHRVSANLDSFEGTLAWN